MSCSARDLVPSRVIGVTQMLLLFNNAAKGDSASRVYSEKGINQ